MIEHYILLVVFGLFIGLLDTLMGAGGGSIAGAITGALTTQFVPRQTFDLLFLIILSAASIYIFIKPPAENQVGDNSPIRISNPYCHGDISLQK